MMRALPRSGPRMQLALRLGLFLLLIGALAAALNAGSIRPWIAEPITRLSVACASLLVRVLGGSAQAEGFYIAGPRTRVEVLDGCNGLEAMSIYLAAVVVHDATVRSKLIGLLAGLPLIWGINLARIASLYAIAAAFPDQLELFHIYIWQTLIVLGVFGIWCVWASRALRRPLVSETDTGEKAV